MTDSKKIDERLNLISRIRGAWSNLVLVNGQKENADLIEKDLQKLESMLGVCEPFPMPDGQGKLARVYKRNGYWIVSLGGFVVYRWRDPRAEEECRDRADHINSAALAWKSKCVEGEVKPLVEALKRLRDCDWTIGIGDRMDPVRDIARKALEDFRSRPGGEK